MVNEERKWINLAKRLLIQVFNRIPTYDQILSKIADESRKDLLGSYNSSDDDIYGVFSKDDYFKVSKRKEKGTKLVQKISSSICKKFNKIVITGDKIYYPSSGKIKTEKTSIQNIIKKAKIKDKRIWKMTFSKILGEIPNCGVFLIDNQVSASNDEASSFNSRDTKFGLGVIIPHKKIKSCRHLFDIKKNYLFYSKCGVNDYNLCTKKRSGCSIRRLRINKTTIQPFINRITHSIIFVTDLKNIEKIISNMIEFEGIHSK